MARVPDSIQITNSSGIVNANIASSDVGLQSINRDLTRTVLTLGASDNLLLSDEIDMTEFNALDVRLTITGTATFFVKIKGSQVTGGNFVDRYDVGTFNTTRGITIPQVPSYCKIEVTRQSGTGTCAVDVQPCNAYGSIQRPTFKEYVLAFDIASLALNTESAFFDVYNTEWVKAVVWAVNSQFDYQTMYRHLFSNGEASAGNNVGGNQTKTTNFLRTTTWNTGSFQPSYGLRFSLKNVDASVVGWAKAHLILIGG